MVLTQPCAICWRWRLMRSFHTTMVLTQPLACCLARTNSSWVSIPLWFLRNPLLLQRYYTGFGQAESNERKALTRVILSVFWRFVWIRFEKSWLFSVWRTGPHLLRKVICLKSWETPFNRSLQKKTALDFAFNQMTYPQSDLCKLYKNDTK